MLLAVACRGGDRRGRSRLGRSPRVVRVVDGDTVVVPTGGREERVRYIGVDTPESVKPGTPVQCFAKAASRRTSGSSRARGAARARRRGTRPLRPPARLRLPRATGCSSTPSSCARLRPAADDPAERRARRGVRPPGEQARRAGRGYGAAVRLRRPCGCGRASRRSRRPSSRRSRRIVSVASGCAGGGAPAAPAPSRAHAPARLDALLPARADPARNRGRRDDRDVPDAVLPAGLRPP